MRRWERGEQQKRGPLQVGGGGQVVFRRRGSHHPPRGGSSRSSSASTSRLLRGGRGCGRRKAGPELPSSSLSRGRDHEAAPPARAVYHNSSSVASQLTTHTPPPTHRTHTSTPPPPLWGCRAEKCPGPSDLGASRIEAAPQGSPVGAKPKLEL